MKNEMNVFEKILYVQQRVACCRGAASDGEALAFALDRLRPHLGRMKLVVLFSDDVENFSDAAFVRSAVTVINVEAPYDRCACTAYEPLRAVSDGEKADAARAARRKALEGIFALCFGGAASEEGDESELEKALATEVAVLAYGGMKTMPLGDMTTKQLEWAERKYAKNKDVQEAIAIVKRAAAE